MLNYVNDDVMFIFVVAMSTFAEILLLKFLRISNLLPIQKMCSLLHVSRF